MSSRSPLQRLIDATHERERLRQQWDRTRNTELLSLLVLTVPRLLRSERCGLFVASTAGDEVWLQAGTGVLQRQIVVDADKSMVGEVLRTGKPLIKQALPSTDGAHQDVSEQTHFTARDALTIPIRNRTGDRVIGALQVLNRTDGGSYGEDDIAQLDEIAFAIQGTIARIHAGQAILDEAEALDVRIQHLAQTESALRGDRMLRTFEPAHELPGGGFLHHRWQGTCYPPFIDPAATRALSESWETDPNDVFLCTHQKVGTHLAKKFIALLVQELLPLPDDHPYRSGDIGHHTIPWPEVLYSQHGRGRWKQYLERTVGHPRLWYIHCGYPDLPVRRIHPRTRFVVVVRDPRSVAVSQYFFWKRHPLLRVPPSLDLDSFVQRFVQGDLYFGDYHHHVLGWLSRADRRVAPEQVLVLTYEQLVEDKLDAARQLAGFLAPGRPLPDDRARAIAAATDFDTMKQAMTANPGSFHLDPKVYFRAGTTRDWAQHLSNEAVAAIDQKTREVWGGQSLASPPLDGIGS